MVFSFYYTDKISSYVLETNQLYKEIESKAKDYYVASIPAVIDNNYIIPGLSGSKVNIKDSFFNMKSINTFNDSYLVYKEIIPKNSIKNNIDKIIKNGNTNKLGITFIIEQDEDIKKYFINNNINADILIDESSFLTNSSLEQLNNDVNNYKSVEKLLDDNNLNTNICIINNNIENICRELKKYLIEPKILNNNTFYNIKNNITSGDIILVKKGTNIDNIKVLIDNVKFRDLNIIYLSRMIDEAR